MVKAKNFKFGTPMQNTIHMTISKSKLKPEVEFQYGGFGRRPFSQIGRAITQPWIEL